MLKVVLFISFFGLYKLQSDFVPDNYEEIKKEDMGSFGAYEKCGEGSQLNLYKCVVYHRCDPDTKSIIPDEEEVNTNGFGLIDIRIGENSCEHHLDVCCKIPEGGVKPPSPPPPTEKPTPDPRPPVTPPTTKSFCGIRNNNGIDFKITGNSHREAEYGEFPWMLAILKSDNQLTNGSLSICGGSLITPRVVLTGAHCVHKFVAGDIKVRGGEWDTQTTKERLPYQERRVTQIIVHEEFQDGILYNDVALLILAKPFKKAEHIATICLPEQGEVIHSQNCIATGWGKNLFGREGEYQVILKKIELPIVPHQECEDRLKETRLGKRFKLHESFLCAGGEEGKDTCTGDGGSPLVCPDPHQPGRYVQAGIVAWGIGCLTTNPGVYADVAKFRNWVDGHLQRLNVNTQPYVI